MKKYLFIALAALGFAACAEKMDDNSPVQKGELEESYIAINLMSADVDTRAVTDDIGNADEYGYEKGTENERKITSAHFFFFKEGTPFNVNTTNAPATAPGGNSNHISLNITDANPNDDAMENVSDIKDAVLVLSTYKGYYPNQIVAVLNWTPANRAYTLEELHEVATKSLGNDTDGYVMSNSVYMDGSNKMVDVVNITDANIKLTPEDAKSAPIDIYVERTAAKVVLTANGKVAGTDNIFDTQKNSTPIVTLGSASEIDVYVKLHGWELYNDYSTSSLLKNIDTTWDPVDLGLTWNDIPYYRCYWAESQNTPLNDSFSWKYEDASAKGFQTNYGFKVATAANYTDRATYTYCGENTNGEALRTKVILKGQLMQKNDLEYEPLELARWYGTEYAGNEALRIAVANSLKYTLFSSDDQVTYSPIQPEDLQCVAGEPLGAEAYEVGFQLSTAGKAKRWYQYSSESGHEVFGDIGVDGDNSVKTDEYLKGVEPALLYAEGMTYYIVDIKHLGATGKTAEYGVVRNHVYQIDINSISGYGSPVYSALDFIVDQPEYPIEDEASYVAARINVLSWKVVKQGVNVGQ